MDLGNRNKRFLNVVILIVLVLGALGRAGAGVEFPGPGPGAGQCRLIESRLVLENAVLSYQWDISGGRLKTVRLVNKLAGAAIDAGQAECFQLVLDGGRILKASELRIIGMPQIKNIEPDPKSCRLGERFTGKEIIATLVSSDGNLKVHWHAMLRDGSNYVRQQITFTAKNKAIDIKEIVLWELAAKAEWRVICSSLLRAPCRKAQATRTVLNAACLM